MRYRYLKGLCTNAKVFVNELNESETLYVGNEMILRRWKDGAMMRFTDEWNSAIQRCVKVFCGIDKKVFMQL